MGRLKVPPLPAEYPVDGLTLLTPPRRFDGPLLPLLLEIPPIGRLSAELRLRIDEAPLLAAWELNPLAGRGILAAAFPICLPAGSILPNPPVLESQKWFEINFWFPWAKKPL